MVKKENIKKKKKKKIYSKYFVFSPIKRVYLLCIKKCLYFLKCNSIPGWFLQRSLLHSFNKSYALDILTLWVRVPQLVGLDHWWQLSTFAWDVKQGYIVPRLHGTWPTKFWQVSNNIRGYWVWETCCMSSFWFLEFSDGSKIFGKFVNLWLKVLKMRTSVRINVYSFKKKIHFLRGKKMCFSVLEPMSLEKWRTRRKVQILKITVAGKMDNKGRATILETSEVACCYEAEGVETTHIYIDYWRRVVWPTRLRTSQTWLDDVTSQKPACLLWPSQWLTISQFVFVYAETRWTSCSWSHTSYAHPYACTPRWMPRTTTAFSPRRWWRRPELTYRCGDEPALPIHQQIFILFWWMGPVQVPVPLWGHLRCTAWALLVEAGHPLASYPCPFQLTYGQVAVGVKRFRRGRRQLPCTPVCRQDYWDHRLHHHPPPIHILS